MYVDPKAGAISLASYFADWSQRQVWAPTTTVAMKLTVEKVRVPRGEAAQHPPISR